MSSTAPARTLHVDFSDPVKAPVYTFTGEWNGRAVKVVMGGLFKAYRKGNLVRLRATQSANTQLQEAKK